MGLLDSLKRTIDQVFSPETRAANAAVEEKRLALQAVIDRAVADRRISPAEDAEIRAVMAQHGLTGAFAPDVQGPLDRFARLWRIENEALPVVTPSVRLQRGEVCHAAFACAMHELRKVTQGAVGHGLFMSVPIVKGVRYRVGAMQGARVTSDQYVKLDTGMAHLTNQRLIFSGPMKSKTIRVRDILSLRPYADGIGVELPTGKSPVFTIVADDLEEITVIFAEVLARAE